MNFSKGEEDLMEAQVKSIADSGANVVVTGGKIADMALHYANKYKLMVVRWEKGRSLLFCAAWFSIYSGFYVLAC